MNRFLALGIALVGFGGASASADAIININAQVSGEQIGDVSCTVTCDGALISPVQVTLGPGTYSFSDAYGQPGALYDAWNYSSGWAWHWKVLYDDGSGGSTVSPANYGTYLIADVDPTQSFGDESSAASLGQSTAAVTITLASTTTLDFVVNDYYLPDNSGGVSLGDTCTAGGCLSSPVPEPSSWVLCATAFLLTAGRLRRRSASDEAKRGF